MIRCDISKTLGKQKKCPQLESLWGTLSKNFQCKSCIKAESLNGVLAAISSTVCLFFFFFNFSNFY